MLFADPLFLFAFLPLAFLCYYVPKGLFGHRIRNSVLLLFSYFFYLFGAAEFLLLLMASTLADYGLGLLIDHRRRQARLWVCCSLVINLGLLAYFKYANFFVAEFNAAASSLNLAPLEWTRVVLPIGISFFTFQKISYIIDVYRKDAAATANIIDFALYVAMFPQLIAGPIVRFKDIQRQLKGRMESIERFYTGALRFCWGLAKKVIVADACGQVADAAFGLPLAELDTQTAWLGALAYTLQIYFDFSGYSDMAIGLAALFGFELRENFNRPYAAVSITDFWRRWHISLSRWFRDYLYIPLGGSYRSIPRTYLNLLVVFLLCGLWHGANWTFIVWGLYHGVFLVVERASGLRRLSDAHLHWLRRPMTLLIIVFGWVIFRSESLGAALGYWHAMVIPSNLPLPFELYSALNHRNILFMALGCVGFLGAAHLPKVSELFRTAGFTRTTVGWMLLLLVLPYCAAFLLDGAPHPFIYFRF